MTSRIRSGSTACLIALLVTFGAVGAACSSDDDNASKTTTTTTTRPAEEDSTSGSTATTTGGDGNTTSSETPATDTTVGSGPAEDPQDYVDALASSMSGDGFVTDEQGNCLGEGWIEVIGFERIQAAGLSPDAFAAGNNADFAPLNLDADDGNALYDQFGECDIDLVGTFMKSFNEGDLTDEQKQCFEEVLTDENIRASFVSDFLGDDSEDPLDGASACMVGEG